MRRRMYFLVPDTGTAQALVDKLLLARIEERHIHVIAREGTHLEDLPEASLAQKSDVLPALGRGAAYGGAAGVLAGLTAVAVPGSVVAGGLALLGLGTAGAGIGAWAASMIGVSAPNTELKRFEEAIEKGELLMLVDVPRDDLEEVEQLVRNHHPQARIGGTEAHMPPFP